MNFEEVFSYEHLFQSGRKCCNNVRWKRSTQMFEINLSKWVSQLHNELMSGTYKSKGFTEFDIMERGKQRHIQSVHISERCVQKCLCEYYLKPLLQPKLITDNSANIKGKGTEYALKRLKQQLANHYKQYERQGGVLIVDYHDYFASINHVILLNKLRKVINDDQLYDICKLFVDCFKSDVGLGLGSEVSQIFAVYYPNEIDHYIKEHLHIKGYGRYMDDSIAIHQDIDYLYYCLDVIRAMSYDIGLELNPKQTKIVRLTDGFEYLKKRILLTDTGKIVMRLDRDNITHRRQVLKKQAKNHIDPRHSYQCWRGYASHYNSYMSVANTDLLYRDLFKGGHYAIKSR